MGSFKKKFQGGVRGGMKDLDIIVDDEEEEID